MGNLMLPLYLSVGDFFLYFLFRTKICKWIYNECRGHIFHTFGNFSTSYGRTNWIVETSASVFLKEQQIDKYFEKW